MKYIIFLITIVLNFVLTKDFFGQLTLGGAIPNLNLLLVIIVASESERLDFLFLAFIAGVLTDIGFGLPLGTFTLGYVFSGVLMHILFHGPLSLNVDWKNFALATIVGVLLTYIWTITFNKLIMTLGVSAFPMTFSQLWHIIIFTLIYNLILAFPLFWIYTAITGYIGKFNRKTLYLG